MSELMYADFLTNRVARMFAYSGLPDSINPETLERELLTFGVTGIPVAPKGIYRGQLGGELSSDFLPSRFIGTNPAITPASVDFKFSGVDVGGVAFFNTTADKYRLYAYYRKLDEAKNKRKPLDILPYTALYEYILSRAEMLNELDVSAKSIIRTMRAMFFVSAKDEQTKTAAEIALKRILSGETATVFLSNILDSINFTFAPTAANAATMIKELREEYQFILAQFYHAIGINANFNLKRERLNTAEVELNDEPLLVNIIDMLDSREVAISQLNALLGINAAVELADEWKRRAESEVNDVDKPVELES